jgi:magnesium chelatase accessory protein
VPRLVAWRAQRPAAIDRLIRSTGSIIDAQGVALYARLVRNAGHVAGVLKMMTDWDLESLARDLPRLPCPLTLLVGSRDRTVDPAEAMRVQACLPSTAIVDLAGLGHLAHEERPTEVAGCIGIIATAVRVLE